MSERERKRKNGRQKKESKFEFYCFDLDWPRLHAFDDFISQEITRFFFQIRTCLILSAVFKSTKI